MEALGEVTGSPVYDIALNAGYAIFWLKNEYPEKWHKVEHILFLPQYISYRLSGKMSVDLTSLGCHTLLYDFMKGDWSQVARQLGVVGKITEHISHPWQPLGPIHPDLSSKTGIAEDCRVVCGIHRHLVHFCETECDIQAEYQRTGTGYPLLHRCLRQAFQGCKIHGRRRT